MSPDRKPNLAAARDVAVTFGVAACGAVLAWSVAFPAPWLVGAVMATSAASLANLVQPLPNRLRDVIFVLLGASMGSAVTPDTIRGVALWPGSMAALGIAVSAMVAASYLILRRGFGWDRVTAFYASPPGALSATLAMAATTSADMSKVAVVQVFRVFVLVAVAPVAIAVSGAHAPPLMTAPQAGLGAMAAILGSAGAGALLFKACKLPGGLMVGAFGASAALHASGVLAARLPDWLTLPTFVALGAIVGTRFAGLTPRAILALMRASLASFAATAGLGIAFAVGVGWSLGLPAGQVFVAFAPGGLEAMMLTAYLLGLDPAYVGAHHVARFIALSFAVPIVARLIGAGVTRAPESAPERDR
ncbi:AbrB family transcriptional regulator [Hansschlegelia zhihuaiae]|uniref:AbrB family transcriptional regulator n=1 Tax=Hansschlegelia zhihuaiae TaxID=405005 RepID=A0A4Q0MID1_9HYPH|nr:AbrB family transcriptional regulator [Hansschlegelia zhihuaiae]RXF73125.1 AbrB family transcriptional regulator [Hansschlegelia zhihuaiae]